LHQNGEIDTIHYFDPTDGTTFSLNHLNLTTADESVESNQDSSLESFRAAIQSAVSTYIKTSYSAENSAGSVYAKDGLISVVITGEKANLRNFWSGKWTSTWTISTDESGAHVSGDIKVFFFVRSFFFFTEKIYFYPFKI
jgi:capping protein alpha